MWLFHRIILYAWQVDEQGNRSGPSDYAVAPRPVVHSKPVLAQGGTWDETKDPFAMRQN